jgi:hypothetical protein
LWEELEKVPETEFEKDLARDDSEASFVLSKNNLNALKELKTKVNFPVLILPISVYIYGVLPV